MTTLLLGEWETRHGVTLRPATAALLRSAFHARVEPSRVQNGDEMHWDVTPVGVVGALDCGPDRILVRPKVEIENVLFMLSVGSGRDPWQAAEDARLARAQNLTAAVAALFLRLANQALARGVLRGYREEHTDLTTVRGRIDLATQLRRRPGLLMPLAMTYDEHDEDILENRLLLAATSALRPVVAGSPEVSRGLHRLRALLSGVAPIHVTSASVPEVHWTRLNDHYQAAVEMARTILSRTSIDVTLGETTALGITLDMASVFEDFLEAALGRQLEAIGGRARTQVSCFLDTEASVRMQPDLVWYATAGAPRAVVDAKYKRETTSGAHDADLYQLLAYCTALHLGRGHLVYAQGAASTRTVRVMHEGPEIHAHALDLTQEPRALISEVADLSQRIAQPDAPPVLRGATFDRVGTARSALPGSTGWNAA